MVNSELEPSTITKGRYTYIHDVSIGPSESIDVHHIIVSRRCAGGIIFCTQAFLFALISCIILLLLQDKSVSVSLYCFVIAGFLLRQSLRKLVKKESVIILPAFGVQLETFYMSGRTVRHFVPIDKILSPVLNECVTPVTCYWSLSLIIREHEQLLLVFKELYPPLSMLVPIWKALCASIESKECVEDNA